MQLNLLVVSYLASAGLAAAVAIIAWRRTPLVGARGLAFLMLAVAWWLLANAFEAMAVDRTSKIAWAVVSYPGIVSVPVLYLLFVLGWTRQDRRLTRTHVALLFLVPLISVGMAATNEWHRWLWPSVTLSDAWGVTAVYSHGPWFWIEMAYGYTLVGAGLVALLVAMYRYPEVYSTRMRLAIVGSFAPIVGSVLYAAGWGSSVHADLSSIAFALAGLVAAWAILRLQMLEVVPVTWATLVDTFADAVLVLDPERRIATFNAAATALLGVRANQRGQAADDVLHELPELVAICGATDDREAEIRIGRDHPRWFNVRRAALPGERGRDAGSLVVLRDVTELRHAVETIRTLSHTDELTGLLNRRGFTSLAEQQIRTSMRTRNRLWLLFADVDGLKDINDRLGHAAGDRALCEAARLLGTMTFREADIVARFGGDEFALLATEISNTDGAALVERLEEAVRVANEAPDRECQLTVSVGTAAFDPERPQSLDELIREADRRMYQVKHGPRTTARAATGAAVVHDA